MAAILLIAGTVSAVFVAQRGEQRRARPPLSAPLSPDTAATAEDWQYEIKDGDRPKARIRAREFRQVKEPSAFLLAGLEMRIYGEDPATYDLVRSARASFDTSDGLMYSEGEVEITMGVRADGSGGGKPVKIRASGVSYDARTSKVWTDRHTEFELEGAGGTATGASYNPETKELRLEADAVVLWEGRGEGAQAMRVEAGQMVYIEGADEIYLMPWARLHRGTLRLDSGPATVHLKEGAIERVEASGARGVDQTKDRRLDFAAAQMVAHFTPAGEMRQVTGGGGARVESRSSSGATVVTAPNLHLDFAETRGGSELSKALATGGARVENTPKGTAPRRVLVSEVVELKMRPGGQEAEELVTHTPGEVEFVPQNPNDKRRRLSAERLTLAYAPGNALELFRAAGNVLTRTETPQPKPKPVLVTVTRSRDLQADFDRKTGQLDRMEQWTDFEYEEEGRRARANRAGLDQASGRITLNGNARVWDEGGSTDASQIIIEQKTGEMTALGGVTSTRLPDAKAKRGGLMQAGETLRARAQTMRVRNDNREIEYEGDALMWQGENRLRAPIIRIDRQKNTLAAEGGVLSSLPVDGRGIATIRARSLRYDDAQKLAVYTGAASLSRPGLDLKGETLRLWFVEEPTAGGGTETKLDRLFADKAAEVVEKTPERTRTGRGEHLEYYARDERMVLTGGNPLVQDSNRGISRGAVITWYSRQDRLIVDNTGAGPGVSVIQRGKNN